MCFWGLIWACEGTLGDFFSVSRTDFFKLPSLPELCIEIVGGRGIFVFEDSQVLHSHVLCRFKFLGFA